MKKTFLGLVVSSMLLTGCGALTRTDYEAPPVQVPVQWQQKHIAGDVNIDPWWYAFDDALLNEYIEQALKANNDLALATFTLKKARLQMGLADDEMYPQLSSTTSAGVSKPLDGGDSTDSYSTRLSVSYELDLWGKVSANVDQARWSALATLEDRESTAQSLVATTASLYWQIGYLKQRIALSESDVTDAQKTLDLISRQYQLGAVSQLDVLEAKRTLAGLQAQQSQYQQQLVEANNAFAILFDQPPLDMTNNVKSLPDTDLPTVTSGVPADLLIRRPDVKAAIYDIKSNLAAKDSADLGYLPTLTLTGALGGSSEELKELLSNPIGSLGADLTLPFLQWNDMENDKAIADVDYQSAIVSYRQVLYSAFQDVENALSARDQLIYQRQRLQEQYDAAQQAEQIYTARYKYGSITIMELLDSQENTRDAKAALLENRYNQFVAQVALYQALGGQDVAPKIDEMDI